jgi:hypothetical protein
VNRHRAYFPIDDAPAPDGDGQFVGVNARLDPAQLADGEVAHAVNCRFDNGRAETRKGIRIMTWGARGIQGGGAAVAVPYGPIRRAQSFNDPITGIEWMIVVRAADNDLPLGRSYRARAGVTGAVLTAPAGTDFDACTDLIQTYNGMVMLRGADLDPLYLSSIDEGWKPVLAPSGADVDKEAIPPSTYGLYFGNRLLVVDARADARHIDTVWVSDFGATTSVLQGRELFYQSFKINQGSSDRLVGIAKFNDTTLVAAKARSIYVVSNITGTNDELAQNATLDQLTDAYGCIAPRSFVQVGRDLWFLGHRRGICSVTQTTTNALQGVDVPVSRDIQPVIDRINWEHAHNAVAQVHDNRVFFAVPLDSATDNNAVLVYSTLTKRWAGYDLSAATIVRDFVKFTYAGGVRLGFLSTNGFVCLYEDGYHDHTGDEAGHLTYNPIPSLVRTRGYGGRVAGVKRFTRYTARLRTWNPAGTVVAVQDGQQERRVVSTVAADNTRYRRPYGRNNWDPSNGDGDWSEPYREDYAFDMGIDGGVNLMDADGNGTAAFGVHQETEIAKRLRDRGNHVQIEIAATRGRIEVAGVMVEAIRGRTADGTKA